jgi:hypothetical protein
MYKIRIKTLVFVRIKRYEVIKRDKFKTKAMKIMKMIAGHCNLNRSKVIKYKE